MCRLRIQHKNTGPHRSQQTNVPMRICHYMDFVLRYSITNNAVHRSADLDRLDLRL